MQPVLWRKAMAAASMTSVMLAVSWCSAGAAEAPKLPLLSACKTSAAPALPAQWRAVGLLLPFQRRQIDVGEFVYDGTLPALRATVLGLESGAVDLLITDQDTYQLSGPPESPNACVALGRKYSPPITRWLAEGAVCDGEGPLNKTQVEWWKTAAPEGRTNWQWYRTDTRLPWRLMFSKPSPAPAVIGDYGIVYFPSFSAVNKTNLASLREFCASKSQPAAASAAAAATVRELMAIAPDVAGPERSRRIAELVPGLSQQACSRVAMPRWPNRYIMTGILSPVLFKWTPLPSMIYYDWESPGAMYAWMHEARTRPPVLELVSVLTKGIGYSIERLPNGSFACVASSPGTVRPDWMSVAGCECKAVIDRNRDLDADEVTQIRACPVKDQKLRVNWTWYSAQGRPILFTEPGATSSGLNIADYLDWWPDAAMPASAFELPRLCTHAADAGLPPVGKGLPAAATTSCSDCHTTQQ